VKVPTSGRATDTTVPLAMIDDALPGARPSFYKLQQDAKNETTGEVEWVDIEIEGPR
jgi:hypothetical protein